MVSVLASPTGRRRSLAAVLLLALGLAGQDWLVYHAIDRRDPYLDEPFGINQRPMLLDRLDWIGGWPTVRAGRWASQGPQRAPVTNPAAGGHPVTPRPVPPPRVGPVVYADGFGDGTLGPGWSWVREPAALETGGVLRWPTQAADLVGAGNDASVLARDAPAGAYTVETKLAIDLGENDVRNFQQAGLVAYVNDPANGEHEFRAASSRDGRHWTWGGVWTLPAGTRPRIGLISHGGAGAVAEFDYLRVHRP